MPCEAKIPFSFCPVRDKREPIFFIKSQINWILNFLKCNQNYKVLSDQKQKTSRIKPNMTLRPSYLARAVLE